MRTIFQSITMFFCLFLCISVNGQKQKEIKSVVRTAEQLIGTPYKYGGKSPNSGFDCSGLTHYTYQFTQYKLNRKASEQAKQGKRIKTRKAKAGDLVFFKEKGRITHVGIVISSKRKPLTMIHASSSKGVIRTKVFDSAYWKKRFKFVRRVL